MTALGTSRSTRAGLGAMAVATIFAVILMPLLATGVVAKSNHHREHRNHAQQQAAHRDNDSARARVEIDAKEKSKSKKKKGSRGIGNPATPANPKHSSPDPITRNEVIDPPTLGETGPGGLPDGYNQFYRTRTFGESADCRTRNVGAWCHLYETELSSPVVQLDLIADPLACGDGLHIGVWSSDSFGGYVEVYQGYVPAGESTGPITFPEEVYGYSIGVRGSSAQGCDASSYGVVYSVSATIEETTIRRDVILKP